MHFIIAAGGTGGHIMPALAVAESLREERPDSKITFVGIGSPLEDKLIRKGGFDLEIIAFSPFRGRGVKGLLRLLWRMPFSLAAVLKLYRRVRPDVVLGFGGYPSVMPLIGARLMGIPSVLQEQNQEVGLANRLLSLLGPEIFAVPGTRGFWRKDKVSFLPNPVRNRFHDIPELQAPPAGQAPPVSEPLRLLVVGGSQGAVSLNDEIIALADFLRREGVLLIHQSGELDFARVTSAYKEAGYQEVKVVAFIDDMAAAYADADLVICRAGAMTVAEVSAAGRPAIFVPLRIAGGHQRENARFLVEEGAALMVEHGPECGARLRGYVEELLRDRERLSQMASSLRRIVASGESRPAIRIARHVIDVAQDKADKRRSAD